MLASEVWSPSEAPPLAEGGLARPRIAICGIAIEASTFSPHRSGDEAFTEFRGEELLALNPFLAPGQPYREAAEWLPVLKARSMPGGRVVPATYERLKAEIVAGLRTLGPIDAVWFDIHGAMYVDGMLDAEGDLVTAVRDAVGPTPLIAASMDLHGNVSPVLAEVADHLTCYRMAPHEDAPNTRRRLAYTLLSRLRGPHGADTQARLPWKARIAVPILLPGEKTSTRLEPATSLYADVAQVALLPGIEDASFWIGYAWADEPRCNATVMVCGDDVELITTEAERLANEIWAARAGFDFVAPTEQLDACLDRAQQRIPELDGPFVISDSGDNPTAGGADDTTYALHHVLAHPIAGTAEMIIVASVFDAESVAACRTAGVGAEVDLPAVGAKVDHGPSGPVALRGRVHSLFTGDARAGDVAVIACGSVHAIITERRKAYHLQSDFRALDLDPTTCDVLIVKIGYLEPELYDLAADWLLALTPGGVDQDLIRLGHQHIDRPMFPFDPDMADPDLSAVLTRRTI